MVSDNDILKERIKVLCANVIRSFVFDEEGNNISLREFARMLNECHEGHDLDVSYQTIKNWMDAVHKPRDKWVEGMLEECEQGSLGYAVADDLFKVIYSEVSL